MMFAPIWLHLKKQWWLFGLLIACALFGAWQFSRRPDVVPPRIYGSGFASSSMKTVDVSMYEYTDKVKWITNGRSITFRIPIAYLSFTAALSGGAQSHIPIDFDYETGEPWTREHFATLRAQSALEAPRSADAYASYPGLRRLGASLSIFHRPFDEKQARGLLGAKQGNSHWIYRHYVYVEDSICGYDMFRKDYGYGARHLRPPRYPFNKATIFARASNNGYDTMVECTWLGDHAWCHATREFDGFPLTVYFDGSRLCDVDAVFARATEVLNGFVVQRTPPVEGWGSK
jgi:hypothetical protein